MDTMIGFDSYTSHTRVSDNLCIPTIIDGISHGIDKFRDTYRLYRVMGISIDVHDRKSYMTDVGLVMVYIRCSDEYDIVFDLTETVVGEMVQSYDFKSRGLSYSGKLDNIVAYNQIVKKIVDSINSALVQIYAQFVDYLFTGWGKTRFNGMYDTIVSRVGSNNFLYGKVHTDYSKYVSMDFSYSLVASVDFLDSIDVRPVMVFCREINTVDGVLDVLEMISFVRDMIRSNPMYDFINQYGNTDDLDYFNDKERVSKILKVVNHKIELDYYKKIELDSNISVMVRYGTMTFRGRYLDCKLDFHVSSDAFLRKVMGSAFFDTNRLEEILYTSLYLFGWYVGCWE
jgi:hypothetical protein|nr:MAG TPA: hypothetical protein [Bacteriophage sp.]